MLRNYIKTGWRNIFRSRFYSSLNVIGLAAGLAFTLFVLAYVWNEFSVNRDIKDRGQQYIIRSEWKQPNMGFELATLGMLPKVLKEQYPALVKNYYRWDGITVTASKGEKAFRESLQVGDTSLLDMYGLQVVDGSRQPSSDPFSVIITDKAAVKYFGKADVAGQTISIENFAGVKSDFQVTTVIRKPFTNVITDISRAETSDFFIPITAAKHFGRDIESWNNPYIAGFIQLQPGVRPEQLDKPIKDLVAANASAAVSANLTPQLSQLDDYYFERDNGLVRRMLYTLSGIGLFILLMAIVNFVNMSVSRAASRLKEIGVRKALGGVKRQLVAQFLVESTILVSFSAVLALAIYPLVRPLVNRALNRPLPALGDFPAWFVVFPLLLILVTGFMAGLYPAFILSSFKSVDSLKGKMKSGKDHRWMRQSLVGFQFFTAAVVLIGAVIVSRQVQLFFGSSLGYDKSHLLSAQVPRNWTPEGVAHMLSVRDRLSEIPQVKEVSLSYEVPDGNNGNNISIQRPGGDADEVISAYMLITDEAFARTYDVAMKGGRFFKEKGGQMDSSGVVINETMAKALGWQPQEATGRQIKIAQTTTVLNVTGVMKDFHFGTMQQAIQPIVFTHVSQVPLYRYLSVRLQSGNLTASLAAVKHKWEELMPGAPFEYKFMDETLAQVYATEMQLKQAAYIATALALLIALLGILGTVSLNVHKRTKEIGVRKVLGASVAGIVSLFVKDMLTVLLVAMLLACPVAYFLMLHWLQDYVYHIPITAMPFALTIMSLAAITVILIIAQTIRTAQMNPVKSLRTE
ncbi:ABC transporter permease [Chitinophaga horti]|uniref:ABC transporter permease n=1 Tax=Chitinophaga horti TaxID=2920382 RepID=A0ABY6IV55_9BACT|nr:ABC transporter permease [Chitinophaga horti]UYQ91251.1 ABC transporter permease [Chitinophaga horti]